MPVCTKDDPAPPGEPLFPGAVAAKVARQDWEHPDVETQSATTSIDFKATEWLVCKHCGGVAVISSPIRRIPVRFIPFEGEHPDALGEKMDELNGLLRDYWKKRGEL